MATTIHLRKTSTHPGGKSLGPMTQKDMLRVVGSVAENQHASNLQEANGERPFYNTSFSTVPDVFFSERVDAPFTLSGNITLDLYAGVNSATADNLYLLRARLYHITAGGSDILTLLGEGTNSTALVSTLSSRTFTFTPPTKEVVRNDRFVLKVSVVPAAGETFLSDVAALLQTDHSSNVSAVTFTETITFRDNGIKFYLRRTAVNGIANFFDALESAGAELARSWVATTAGGTKIQWLRQLSPTFIEVAAPIADTSNLSSYISPSFTPQINTLYLLAVVHSDAASETTVPTVTSTTGLTFVQVGSSMPFDTTSSPVHRITLFRALKTSGLSAGTYTVNFGDASTGCATQLIEASNVLTTGTDGADAVRNIVTGSANAGTNPTVTLGAFAAGYNGTYAVFGYDIADVATPGSGYTGHGSETYATPTTSIFTETRWHGFVTLAAGTSLAASDWAGIGVEVVAPTDTTPLEWISPRIREGFVVTDPANFAGAIFRGVSSIAANASYGVDVSRRAPDGTETLVFTYKDASEPIGAVTYALDTISSGVGTLPNGQVAIREDDRVIIRMYLVNVGTMASGHYGFLVYDGPTNLDNTSISIWDGTDLKLETDPARSHVVPSGGSLSGLSNGQ